MLKKPRTRLALYASRLQLRRGPSRCVPHFQKRIPYDFASEFDALLSRWRSSCHPTSPRFDKLRQFLSEIDSLFPEP